MNGENLDDKAAALEGELLGQGEGAGAGAAPGDDADHGPAGPTTGELITALLRPTFDIAAPNWQVTDMECAMLGEAYGAVIDKYFPDFTLGAEVTAVLVTLAVFGPRMRRPAKAEPKETATDDAPLPA
jgi:hypothetical protein